MSCLPTWEAVCATARPARGRPGDADVVFLVGSPATQSGRRPRRSERAGGRRSADQGIVLRNASIRGKAGAGGRAAGVRRLRLWAVYELVERWGVRYLLHGDVLPDRPVGFHLPSRRRTGARPENPPVANGQRLRVRPGVVGAGRTAPRHRPACQAAVQSPVRESLSLPAVSRPEGEGSARRRQRLWYDFHYPITDDMPGRPCSARQRSSGTPTCPAGPYAVHAAGQKLIQGIIAHAQSRGIAMRDERELTEYPPELAPLAAGLGEGQTTREQRPSYPGRNVRSTTRP